MCVQVKEAQELEQAQRVTQDKKYAVHDELIRKAMAQEVMQTNIISTHIDTS